MLVAQSLPRPWQRLQSRDALGSCYSQWCAAVLVVSTTTPDSLITILTDRLIKFSGHYKPAEPFLCDSFVTANGAQITHGLGVHQQPLTPSRCQPNIKTVLLGGPPSLYFLRCSSGDLRGKTYLRSVRL